MRASSIGVVGVLLLVLACGEPTGPEALEESTFTADLLGTTDRSLSGEASLTGAEANSPGDIQQDVWLLSLTAHRPGGRTELRMVGGTSEPQEQAYSVVPFDPPVDTDDAFAVVWVFEGDSVTEQYEAGGGAVTMTKVTGREVYGTFQFEATSGDSSMVTAQGDFRSFY